MIIRATLKAGTIEHGIWDGIAEKANDIKKAKGLPTWRPGSMLYVVELKEVVIKGSNGWPGIYETGSDINENEGGE